MFTHNMCVYIYTPLHLPHMQDTNIFLWQYLKEGAARRREVASARTLGNSSARLPVSDRESRINTAICTLAASDSSFSDS